MKLKPLYLSFKNKMIYPNTMIMKQFPHNTMHKIKQTNTLQPGMYVTMHLSLDPDSVSLVIFIPSFVFRWKMWFFFLWGGGISFFVCLFPLWVCGLQSWWGACMCTAEGVERKGKLRESLCFQRVAPMWKCRLPQFLDWWNLVFLKCVKGTGMECGFVSLRFMPITLLNFAAFHGFCWLQGISA